MLTVIILSLTLSFILMLINLMIAKKTLQEREKPSPFECGFDPKNSARLPFSLRFYLIAVVFLIFDIEITLLLPIPIIINLTNLNMMIFITLTFIFILIVGLYHEWNQGALNWNY